MKKISCCILGAFAFTQIVSNAWAWNYPGHHTVNELALASLPTNFPAFVKTPAAQDRIAFLAGEPDRWRNTPELSLKHVNAPDHYIDLEQLADYDLTPETLPPLRYDFVAKLALARAAHPDKFPPIDPKMDMDHTRELVGFLPWEMSECYAKLKSEFSYLKAFQESGTPAEIANAQENIIYTMGVMGHYFGDASQPLHTTYHHHGWVGENPNHYTTNTSFHAWIDGDYFEKTGGIFAKDLTNQIHTAGPLFYNGHAASPTDMFPAFVAFLVQQNKLVEPLYQLEKAGKLTGEGATGLEGRKFLDEQIVKGGQQLGEVWVSAWQQATPDTYLKRDLEKRKAATTAPSK
ncbi:MAG TPA: hypothetical protein VH255_01870 [Verrucomicrobiae bacterium]|nr:hypothetical protein [Verrucomicrobiae bacterium]